MKNKVKIGVLIAIALICGGVMFSLDPIPQDLDYHDFIDKRGWMGIPNFGDTMSNLPYFFVGLMGIWAVQKRKHDTTCFDSCFERHTLLTAFVGIFLVCFGSGYYHLEPSNETLFWDRLPMTIGFMGLYAMLIGERVNERAGRILFPILLILGVASAVYWHISEQNGQGDLRPYALVQFFPLLTAPLILLMFKPKYSGTKYLWFVMLWYAVAKVTEHFDETIFDLLAGAISGHTLKHLSSALGTYYLVLYVQNRRLMPKD